jgi:DNA-binding HxlR family transcriptional regulator
MQRKSFADMACPIARGLEQVGEWWSMLILRDAFAGKSRFDEFQASLGIATNMLTRRLARLVEAGMLEKRPYSERPLRHEYLLTERGRDFRTVLLALLDFGHRHFAVDGGGTRIVDTRTGATATPMLVDRRTGEPLVEPNYAIARRGGGAAASGGRPRRAGGLLAAPLGADVVADVAARVVADAAAHPAAHPAVLPAAPPAAPAHAPAAGVRASTGPVR